MLWDWKYWNNTTCGDTHTCNASAADDDDEKIDMINILSLKINIWIETIRNNKTLFDKIIKVYKDDCFKLCIQGVEKTFKVKITSDASSIYWKYADFRSFLNVAAGNKTIYKAEFIRCVDDNSNVFKFTPLNDDSPKFSELFKTSTTSPFYYSFKPTPSPPPSPIPSPTSSTSSLEIVTQDDITKNKLVKSDKIYIERIQSIEADNFNIYNVYNTSQSGSTEHEYYKLSPFSPKQSPHGGKVRRFFKKKNSNG